VCVVQWKSLQLLRQHDFGRCESATVGHRVRNIKRADHGEMAIQGLMTWVGITITCAFSFLTIVCFIGSDSGI
jgi:hypothetical protein